MLQKASQWAALLASRRACLMGVQQQSIKLSPLVLSSRAYATAGAQVAPEAPVGQPVHSQPPPSIKTSRLTNLGNIEAAWAGLPRNEQERIFTELQELQKKDWKELSLDEKKAAYYISYGAHGPRAPIVPPNTNGKVFLGVVGSIFTAFGVFALVRMNSKETPKTMSKEWKDAQTEMAREQKMDPFTGPARADGKGKVF